MKAAEFFAAVDNLPVASFDRITQGRGLVVVAPHPDDESLGCGGLIAEACARGVAVRLIVVSDGTGSHARSRRYPAPTLRALREVETIAAGYELGLSASAIEFLRLPDSHVPTEGPQALAARNAIVAAAEACDAGAVCVTWCRDPHCDHAAAAALVAAARPLLGDARILSYPIWGWTLAPQTDVGSAPLGLRFGMAQHVEAKAAAIAAHLSQTTNLIDDDPNGFRLSPDMLTRFTRPYEVFLEADLGPNP